MMRILIIFLLVLTGAFPAIPSGGQLVRPVLAAGNGVEYLVNLPDIPLTGDMVVQEDGGLLFDAPEGRVVEEVVLSHSLTPEQVRDFYQSTLPHLGWMTRKSGVFVRNGERLTVTSRQVSCGLFVTFRLSPESAQK